MVSLSAGADPLTPADEPIHLGVLTGRRLAFTGARRKHAVGDTRMHADARVALEDAHEMRVPPAVPCAAHAAKVKNTAATANGTRVIGPLACSGHRGPAHARKGQFTDRWIWSLCPLTVYGLPSLCLKCGPKFSRRRGYDSNIVWMASTMALIAGLPG
jgi:hypothetical protein